MCRLLGIFGQTSLWREVSLAFRRQAENGNLPPDPTLDPGHKDGWGMAVSNREKTAMLSVVRQLGSANDASSYPESIDSLTDRPDIFLCHLRKASEIIPITLPNTHPFFHQGWALIHNGTIYNAELLPRDPILIPTSDGSDSEYFFHYLLTKIIGTSTNHEISQSIANAVPALNVEYTALNSMLSNGKELYVISRYKQWHDYYTLHYYALPDSIIISSQPIESPHLDPDNWRSLSNNLLLKIYGSPPRMVKIPITNRN